jgi:hypothetical protein
MKERYKKLHDIYYKIGQYIRIVTQEGIAIEKNSLRYPLF